MKTRVRKNIEESVLRSLKAVDLTPRRILSHDVIEFRCHSCDTVGSRDFSEAKRSVQRNGFAYQCPACLKEKMSGRGDEWLSKIRAAAQTPEHKARAAKNSINSVKKYFPEDIEKVLKSSGVTFEGDLTSPGNTITVFWPDGVSRRVRIRRFMIDGTISRPKIGEESTGHKKHLDEITALGLDVTPVDGTNFAKITYKGRDWEQYWVNHVDKKCRRMMKNIDTGIQLQSLLNSGYSLNRACKSLGVDPNRYYRNLRFGIGVQDTAESSRNISKLIDIPGAVYDRELKPTKYRPDILVEDHKLIIETDGMRFHTEDMHEKGYHATRWRAFSDLGYRVLAFSEYEVKEKRPIVDSMIAHRMKKSLVVDLSECVIEEVGPKDATEFLSRCHLKGPGSGAALGIYWKGSLVSILRYQHVDGVINISRFASELGMTVRGGYSKLLSKLPDNIDIVNFVDRRHGSGEGLLALGFIKSKIHIGFEWSDGYFHWNRMKFLGNSGYDHNLKKFWDYGQVKYVKKALPGS